VVNKPLLLLHRLPLLPLKLHPHRLLLLLLPHQLLLSQQRSKLIQHDKKADASRLFCFY